MTAEHSILWTRVPGGNPFRPVRLDEVPDDFRARINTDTLQKVANLFHVSPESIVQTIHMVLPVSPEATLYLEWYHHHQEFHDPTLYALPRLIGVTAWESPYAPEGMDNFYMSIRHNGQPFQPARSLTSNDSTITDEDELGHHTIRITEGQLMQPQHFREPTPTPRELIRQYVDMLMQQRREGRHVGHPAHAIFEQLMAIDADSDSN